MYKIVCVSIIFINQVYKEREINPTNFIVKSLTNIQTMEYSFRTLALSDMLDQARQKDEFFVSKFARIKFDGTVVRKFISFTTKIPTKLVGQSTSKGNKALTF
jgi:hypothetical protein